ncbi:ie-1 [Erannis ankeraria nucleopolyhedrovirus]|uniref:ie-1 n=1 Tax=Erannis ankeraria nucleopolyhedrovirus TaxID=2913600 RepID=UPI00117ABD1A|nr:ie-1 [Erannis ankeraria nucleopolyhedrovirus]UJZ88956.1 ie-1 [Erannis ankeraria nucleopolyhedrovirus]
MDKTPLESPYIYKNSMMTPHRDSLGANNSNFEELFKDLSNVEFKDISNVEDMEVTELLQEAGNVLNNQVSEDTLHELQRYINLPKSSRTYGKGKSIKIVEAADEESSSSSSNSNLSTKIPIKNKKKLKRKLSAPKNDIDNGDEPKKRKYVKKARGRYKRAKMETAVKIDKDLKSDARPVDPVVFSIYNSQCKITQESFNEHCQKSQSELINQTADDKIVRSFVDYITNNAYYMFIICKPKNLEDKFRLFYVNCVNSVAIEYTARYSHVDRLVMVVSFDKFKFLISYELLKALKIAIPNSEDFSAKVQAQNKICNFNEVKDFEFKNALIGYFGLDIVYTRIKTYQLFSCIGENKSASIVQSVYENHNNKSLYTLPFNLYRKEAAKDDIVCDVSPYVQNIVTYSEKLKFKTLPKIENENVMEYVLESLKFWLRDKNEKSSSVKDKDCFFTYKYGSVVRMFYNEKNNLSKLIKIKKEVNASSSLIESYLETAGAVDDSHNFILITTKADERITIIKVGTEFFWITSVIKDIIATDIINSYKKHVHHVFNLNKSNRKEINNKHNGMIKLLTYFTGGYLTIDNLLHVAQNHFECNYNVLNY